MAVSLPAGPENPSGGSLPAEPKRRRRDLLRKAATIADIAVSPMVDPRRSLVLSGFWRSGTTWIQEVSSRALDAKLVFESLSVYSGGAARLKKPDWPAELDVPQSLALLMPFADPGQPFPSDLAQVFNAALRGRIRSWFSRHGRQLDVREALKTRVVSKDTRLPLCVASMAVHYPNPIIHLRRDPRAIVGSALRTKGWAIDMFSVLRLRTHLLEIPDGRAAVFREKSAVIDHVDRLPLPGRVAGYWALTEQYADASLAKIHGRVKILQYEELLGWEPARFLEVLEEAGCRVRRKADDVGWERPSSTSAKARRKMDMKDRRSAWKEGLEKEDIAAIEEALEVCGVAPLLERSQLA